MTKQKKKVLAIILVAAVLLGGVLLIHYLYRVARYQNAVKKMTYQDLVLPDIADGVYTGACDVDMISAKVEVAIKGGVIERVTLLEHRNDRGAPAEAIIERILQAQSLQVDAVAGATNSSKVITKAVEAALLS